MNGTRGPLAVTALGLGVVGPVGWMIHRRLANGSHSSRSEFERRAVAELSHPRSGRVATDADLGGLPEPVARYIRRSGAIGRPEIANYHARMHGRIRSGADATWMTFTGEQVNTFGAAPSRLFFIVAAMKGVPIDVFHSFIGADATMQAKALAVVTIVDQKGPEMVQSETVTILNDACVMAPFALIDPAFVWAPIDDRAAQVTFTRLDVTVSATLHFDDADQLIDFVSEDRRRDSTPQRWSTPIGRYRSLGDHWVMSYGEGRWHAPAPEGEFTYLEFELDDISYNVGPEAFLASRRRRSGSL
ncbi:MAG: hypothetical protein E4H05_02200 [Acidimicrobiales bacterium]|nr:MAG: hypothetical protein E4H05_02200 [Acidimicrobiales bacterium]